MRLAFTEPLVFVESAHFLGDQLDVTRRRATDAEKRIELFLKQDVSNSSSAERHLDLREPLAAAAKKIQRKKALIMELRERNNDLIKVTDKISITQLYVTVCFAGKHGAVEGAAACCAYVRGL
jgi:hypothetical protein